MKSALSENVSFTDLPSSRGRPPFLHLVQEDFERVLGPANLVFGAYVGAMLLLAIAAWQDGSASWRSVAVFGGFIAMNAAFSRMSRSSETRIAVEIGRIAAGAVMAPAAYLLAGDPFMRWWPGFLIMCLGGSIYVSLRYRSPWPGRLLASYYAGLLALSEILAPRPHDWTMLAINAGAVAVVGILVAELVALLGMALSRLARQAQTNAEEQLLRLNAQLEERIDARTAELRAALAESRRLAAIIEATSDYVGIADLQGRSVYINQAGCTMVGLPGNASKRGHSVMDCYPEREAGKVREMVRAALGGEVWSGETFMRHANGSEIPVSEVTFALHDDAGRIEYLATIIRDNTAREAAQAELRAAKEAAEAANRAKSAFLASMSHEIRTPMNAVIGMTSLLRETSLTARQRDFVETVRTSGDALLTVINDILDFSKIEAEKLELAPRPFVLRESVEAVLDLLAPRAAEKGLELACLFEPGVPAGIETDVTRLRQILVNLVGNAIKFTESGEVVVSVSSRCVVCAGSTQRHELHFSVRDTGVGIAPDKTVRLFQPFSQVDESPTRAHGGTGLGLAISRRLAELLGGRIWVHSEGLGCGATFHFTLTAPEADVSGDLRRRSGALPELRGKRLLVVDDNATNRRILTLQAQNWGMTTVEAENADEAVARVREAGPFDLALLDMQLPGSADGIDLARALCGQAAPRRLPMVMLTSVGTDTRREVEAIGCFEAWLTKPVKSSQLYDTIVAALAPRTMPIAVPPARPDEAREPRLGERLPLRILVAEDVVVNQKFVRLALEQMGYRADVVADGLEAIDAIQRQPYDVIFMDVQMPELDGLEATKRIRASLPAGRQPYIAAMTANAMQGDREMCLDAGMDDYVSKPVYLAELRAALERAAASRVTEVVQ